MKDRDWRIRTFCIVMMLCFSAGESLAAETNEVLRGSAASSDRPRIGLVLSGGGARGCAHVGVLMVLEEMRIPIDCIAGTSMGAIVGGLYASGMSPSEIASTLTHTDWKDIFCDRARRQNLCFRRKEDDRRYVFDLEVGFRNGRILMPAGFIAGQKLDFMLETLTLRTNRIKSFDELPIPYRAVATDLIHGKAFVLDGGDLSVAMRASMSVPGIFYPVETDNRLLVDGGLMNNLPVDVARSMGADVVIAVDVSTPLVSRAELNSVMAVSRQALAAVMRKTTCEQSAKADVLITPPLGNFSAADFSDAGEAIRDGEIGAREKKDKLVEYSVSKEKFQEYLGRQRTKPYVPERIDRIEVTGNNCVDRRVILARMKLKPGDILDTAQVRKDLLHIYSIGSFEKVEYCVQDEDDDRTALIIKIKEKSWGPNFLHFGLNFSDDFKGNSDFNALVNYTRTHVNSRAAEWRTDLQMGQTRRIFSEFYQPVDYAGMFFVAPSFTYDKSYEDIYNGNKQVAEYEVSDVSGELDLGIEYKEYGELRMGVVAGYVDADPGVGDEDLESYQGRVAGFRISGVCDRLDNPDFPRHGSISMLEWFGSRKWVGGADDYDKLFGEVAKYVSFGRNTLFASFGAGTSLGSSIPSYDEYLLGGFFSFSGYGRDQLRGQCYGVGSVGGYHQIAKLPSALGDAVFVGAWVDAGNVWEDTGDVDLGDLRYGSAVCLGADTVLGSIYLGYGHAEAGLGRVYFSMGTVF